MHSSEQNAALNKLIYTETHFAYANRKNIQTNNTVNNNIMITAQQVVWQWHSNIETLSDGGSSAIAAGYRLYWQNTSTGIAPPPPPLISIGKSADGRKTIFMYIVHTLN